MVAYDNTVPSSAFMVPRMPPPKASTGMLIARKQKIFFKRVMIRGSPYYTYEMQIKITTLLSLVKLFYPDDRLNRIRNKITHRLVISDAVTDKSCGNIHHRGFNQSNVGVTPKFSICYVRPGINI